MRTFAKYVLFLAFFALGAAPAGAAAVRLSVAASLTDAVKAFIAGWQTQEREVEFLPNFASSGALARQIAQGAPADLFISANPKWMQYLVETAGPCRPGPHLRLQFAGFGRATRPGGDHP